MSASTLIPYYRTAGIFLLLTALATAISVPARLMAGADDTPLTDALGQRLGELNLDAAEIARLEASERLAAIGSASVAYGTGGAARLVGGLTLLAASIPMWRAMGTHHRSAMMIAALMLALSGIASAVSGVSAVSLAVLAPEPQAAVVLTAGGSSVGGVEEALFAVRWITGSLGFTLAGLALVALAPVQWRMGGVLRSAAVVGGILGVAMLFIWLDAATVVHRISGIAFLIWLIVAGLWLVAGRVRPPSESLSP